MDEALPRVVNVERFVEARSREVRFLEPQHITKLVQLCAHPSFVCSGEERTQSFDSLVVGIRGRRMVPYGLAMPS